LILTADGRYEARDEQDEIIAGGKFVANPSSQPAEIEFISDKPVNPDDAKRLGIYRLEGDRLTLVVSLKGPRPKTFEPVDDPSVMLTILERKK
jgi:uncharacterized protein (TIGR03067 family)